MREGWEKKPLLDVAQVVMGQSPPGTSYNLTGDGLPFIQGSAEFGERHPAPVKWCTDPRKIAEPGDLLLSVRAPVGDLNVASKRIAVGRGLSIIRGHDELASTSYLGHALAFGTHELVKRSSTGMFSSITGAQLKSLPVALPPLHEQKRIVDLMDSVDAAISAAQAEVDTVSALQGRVLAKEMGSQGADWEKVTFGEVADTLLGKALSRGEGQTEGGTPYLRYANVSWGAIDSTDLNRMTFSESEAEKYSLRVGDLLVAEARHVGKCALVSEPLDGICYQNSLHRVRADESRTSTAFLALVLRHLVNDGTVARFTTAQTIPHLSQGKLRSLPFDLPPLHEQRSIVSVMDALATTAVAAQTSLDRLRDLRSSMLSVLLSGEHEIPASYDQFLDLSEVVQAG